ncbi:hypothetical protein EC957_009345 [Mortierella hygrophila]|uniref:non-specific serine/threonine protein kinase n=1 Tax=Mortierella hygrophila TaxID=979708 RepID=A0A9P6JXY5_9FUNG|nr:hypothetical protein EC957_009345 [Mortierella hygrophila]
MNAVGLHMPPAPQGTILPGTTIQLGRFTVVIDKYIAEGGFAHVYVGSILNNGVIVSGFPVVIKRIAVADKERLAVVNSEIETMKRLGKHKNIVEYMDSCMGKLEHGGYEVLILMEYCGGGPVIDLMNRRLQHRLTEPEILKIFSNVCEAVAYLHYCDPPILHRDIKVENILLSNNDYKLCDFGSATTNILRGDNIPRNVKDIQLLEEEINNHTTLQYRAPEMLDLYMRKGIDEKIDIWALGVLLYKLCYYTTPFEEQGQLAILNARYTIPDHPVFSPALIGLFQSMLKEDPRQRPNIYQVTMMTSTLRGLPCPIQNKYPDIMLAPSAPETSAVANILSHQAVVRPMDVLPSIEPMRRGRPTRSPVPTTPAMTSNDNYTNTFPSTTTAHPSDFGAGFDDSFGQFTQSDPASQFSKIIPTGDAFDFGGSSSSPANSSSNTQAKRSTFDFQSANGTNGTDDFGFELPSTSGDLLHPEPQSVSDRFKMPTQLSGNNQGFPAKTPSSAAPKAKPTANDLFFGSSAGIKFEDTDSGSCSDSPATFSGAQPTTVGLSSTSSNTASPGISKPLLGSRLPSQNTTPKPYQSYQSPNPPLSRGVHSDGTGNSRAGFSGMTSPNVPPRATSGMGSSGTAGQGVDLLTTKMESMDLLQRQRLDQLGQFGVEPAGMLSTQNTQGKARVSDPNRTLDGLRSMDVGSWTGSSAVSVAAPPLAPRPQLSASSVTSPNPELAPLDRNNLAKRDMDAELKLIQLQQKEFERQQQELIQLQRVQLEEQQRQHRQQQEQLQKQQQQQIQLQHEKWQERKRMLKEQEQLSQRQLTQQQDLQQQHQTQQRQQQQQQQQQQQYLPTMASVGDSVGSNNSSSSNSTPSSANAYRQSYAGPSSVIGTPSLAERFTSLPRSSLDEHERYKAPTSQSSNQSSLAGSDVSTPTVPVKSARRTGVNGGATTAPAKVARRTSFNSNLPPGQKPELLPKPTRFRMKDGTGTLMTGEEEAFKRKFPSADMDDDLMQFQTPVTTATAAAAPVSSPYYASNESSPVSSAGYGRASPAPSSYGRTTAVGAGSNNSQYMSPSQRAQEITQQPPQRQHDEEDEEEDEPLVRSRRRHQATPSGPTAAAPGAKTGMEDGGEAEGTPMESVRERVLRMNRVGRVV